jgi:hypothetical protein
MSISMKKQILVLAVLFSCLSFGVNAQVRVSINLNTQPVWGPVGYDRVDYYYIPDIESYYSVSSAQYTYYSRGRWVTSRNLPPRYSNYDLYHGYKVVVNEPSPWMHHDRYRNEYSQYRGRHDQQVIRDSRDERYYANPRHPEHANWQRQHDNGRHEGQGNGRGNDHGNDRRDKGRGNDHGSDRHDNGRGNDHGNDRRDNGRGNDHGNDKHDNGHGVDKHDH